MLIPYSRADGPRVVDAVTLRHFGVIDRMSLLEARLTGYPEPRWVETVRSEILAGMGQPDCDAVLAAAFLGTPLDIPVADLASVFALRVALRGSAEDGGPFRDLGEAESMHVVDHTNGAFVTDDTEAYDFARRRFGSNRVLDTVDLLRESVVLGELSSSEAQQVADAIRNSGRHLRTGHPRTLTAAYFQ